MAVTRKVKMKIIKRLKDGDRVAHIADEFEIAESTVRTIKNELMPTIDATPVPTVEEKRTEGVIADYERTKQALADETELTEEDEDDDTAFVKAIMVGADKIIVHRKTIKVTIEFNKGGG